MSKTREKLEKSKSVTDKVYVYRPGKISAFERSKIHAQSLLNKVIPFGIWSRAEKRTESEIEMYWVIVKELEKIAKEGCAGEIRCRRLS